MTLYRTLVADPPWPQKGGGSLKGREGFLDAGGRSLDLPYRTMTVRDIAALDIPAGPHDPLELDDLEIGAEPAYEGMAMVIEPCLCGGEIRAANNPGMILAAVSAHNQTPQHQEWRAVHALQRPTRRPCPCHGHAA